MSRCQGCSSAGRIMSMKTSSDTTVNQTYDHLACSAVPQATAPLHAPATQNCQANSEELLHHVFLKCVQPAGLVLKLADFETWYSAVNMALSFPLAPMHFYFRQDLRYGVIKPSLTTLLMNSGDQHHVPHVLSCLFGSQLTSLDSNYACQRMFSYNMYNQSKFIIFALQS